MKSKLINNPKNIGINCKQFQLIKKLNPNYVIKLKK